MGGRAAPLTPDHWRLSNFVQLSSSSHVERKSKERKIRKRFWSIFPRFRTMHASLACVCARICVKPGWHVRRKRKCKRKETHGVWTTATQMQTQARCKKMGNFPFLAFAFALGEFTRVFFFAFAFAFAFPSHVWTSLGVAWEWIIFSHCTLGGDRILLLAHCNTHVNPIFLHIGTGTESFTFRENVPIFSNFENNMVLQSGYVP